MLLENLRFHPEEEANDRSSPGSWHRWRSIRQRCLRHGAQAHASTAGVAAYLPAVSGFLMQKELDRWEASGEPSATLAAIIGGAKVSTKIRFYRICSRR